VAKVHCSKSSITMLAIIGDKGEPIGVPKTLFVYGVVVCEI